MEWKCTHENCLCPQKSKMALYIHLRLPSCDRKFKSLYLNIIYLCLLPFKQSNLSLQKYQNSLDGSFGFLYRTLSRSIQLCIEKASNASRLVQTLLVLNEMNPVGKFSISLHISCANYAGLNGTLCEEISLHRFNLLNSLLLTQ